MPLEAQQGVISIHADAIIDNSNHGGSAASDRHFNPAGTGVDAILDEFFHHGRRSLNHFPGGYLAGHFIRQQRNSAHRREYSEGQATTTSVSELSLVDFPSMYRLIGPSNDYSDRLCLSATARTCRGES